MSDNLLAYITRKQHHRFRHTIREDWSQEFSANGLPPAERMTVRFERVAKLETPVILPDEKICFLRTAANLPEIFTQAEWQDIRSQHFIHELGYLSNLSPDYEGVIRCGLLEKREAADPYGKRVIDSVLDLADRYRAEAERIGREDIAAVLRRVPRYGAQTFREALQFFRILHFSLWLEGNYHVTVGRFDQYMYPYYRADVEKGLYTEESALELLEDFFLSFNKDSDLYPGVQQGDNGQSMMLGGTDGNGREVFNDLSRLCLLASEQLRLIDPKINLRVSGNTPQEVYTLASNLTKAGLGFPQYSNDDVVIKGLEKLGYSHADACNYTVAACWEFIIPRVGADIANIAALSYPKVVDTCLHRDLESADTFEDFMRCIRQEMRSECDRICGGIRDVWFIPSPFMNILMGCNISEGGKYNNFGVHGVGIATAADSLAALKKYVYAEQSVSKNDLLEAVDSDFARHGELLPLLRFEAPKLGNNDPFVDDIAVSLLGCFAESLAGRRNCRGGKFRAGTGSAMYYLWCANEIGASPDGRRKGEPFGANFSVSLFARTAGPVSIMKSMAKPKFEDAINGGPLTLEFHKSVFAQEDGAEKIGKLVKYYIGLGGHQLQLNAVNLEELKDAQAHPEKHRQLVVRVWGWSAYFVELDKEYQDHVIARQEYAV